MNYCTPMNIMIEYSKPYYLTFRCCSCNEYKKDTKYSSLNNARSLEYKDKSK